MPTRAAEQQWSGTGGKQKLLRYYGVYRQHLAVRVHSGALVHALGAAGWSLDRERQGEVGASVRKVAVCERPCRAC